MQLWNVRKKDRGFSLIELLVVSIIFAILAAVAVPNLLGMLYKARLSEGIATAEGAIKEAQRQATRLSKTCSIQFGTTTVTRYGRTEQRAFIERTPGAGFTDCLLEDRVLPMDVIAVIGDGSVNNHFYPETGTPRTPLTISFSGKGNTDNRNTIKVYHPDITEQNEKCLVIDGIFGDIQTGIHDDTDGDRSTIEACDLD